MKMEESVSSWIDFPMGPALRKYLGIEESSYRGENASKDPKRDEEFVVFLSKYLEANEPENSELSLSLMEELNVMSMTKMGLKVFQMYLPIDEAETSYDASVVIGTTFLIDGQLHKAEQWFQVANDLDDSQIIPYVNMAHTLYADHRDEEASEWITAGWQLDRNHQKLWELYASIKLSEDKSAAYDSVLEKAFELGSYLGVALASDLGSPDDLSLKAKRFGELYDSGVVDPYFLIEYTACLGELSQFSLILQVIWKAKKDLGKEIPWQLLFHEVQALCALERIDEAKELLNLIRKDPAIPKEPISDLELLFADEN